MIAKVQIVNENDQPIGGATREETWTKGLYHQTIHIIITDEAGNILLQKRSPQKNLYPNRWTNAVSGHVDEGETYEMSASRELSEEIGISTPLKYLGKFVFHHQGDGKIINQFNGVFRGEISHDTPLVLAPEEVSETRWFTHDELASKIAGTPDNLTPVAQEVIRRFIL
jgi:isopentenyl-diphosphate Delta-isomerase